jgi:hypothetical protein
VRRLALLPVLAATLLGAPPAHAWTWPADGPVLRPFLFGDDPYAAGLHRGVDIGGAADSAVRAPAAGTVTFAGAVPGGGRTVTITTADGYAVTLLHLGALGASRGQVVSEGETVGTLGSSGEAEHPEPYVHLGIRIAADPQGYLDPLAFLPARAPAPPPPEAPGPGSGVPTPPDAPPGEPAETDVPAPADVPVPVGGEAPPPVSDPVEATPPAGVEAPADEPAPVGLPAPPAETPVEPVGGGAPVSIGVAERAAWALDRSGERGSVEVVRRRKAPALPGAPVAGWRHPLPAAGDDAAVAAGAGTPPAAGGRAEVDAHADGAAAARAGRGPGERSSHSGAAVAEPGVDPVHGDEGGTTGLRAAGALAAILAAGLAGALAQGRRRRLVRRTSPAPARTSGSPAGLLGADGTRRPADEDLGEEGASLESARVDVCPGGPRRRGATGGRHRPVRTGGDRHGLPRRPRALLRRCRSLRVTHGLVSRRPPRAPGRASAARRDRRQLGTESRR